MYITKVGELFIPGKTKYQEGVFFEYSETGPFLIIALGNPTAKEVEAACTGKVELALYEAQPIIFILHRIHDLEQWSDSPFSIRLYQGKSFDWSEPIVEGQGLALDIVLVDADAGKVMAMRMVGTSTQFARELRAAILRQLEQPFSQAEYDRKIAEVYRKWNSEELLSRSTARHRIGGD